ncbi:hypothetical protein [Streptomyces sp. NRRL S-350]|uniref:hypothetical protein n=1 Tax=Streptomyces sp. NRRL S-350 TaxID=1463902 RepID=UPI0007C5385C|nr:hypothetical protein [Streptomyces sp. NRRL S-350]
MKHTRLTATGAAALIAAGLAVAGAAPASAAPAKAERITSIQQLHESLQQAIAIEQTQNGQLSSDSVGRAALLSSNSVGRVAQETAGAGSELPAC